MNTNNDTITEEQGRATMGKVIELLETIPEGDRLHGRRRTTADKRCAVAIALREFGKLSDRAIADMCAVSHHTVATLRKALDPSIGHFAQCPTRTTSDGRQYPAQRKTTARPSHDGPEPEAPTPRACASPFLT